MGCEKLKSRKKLAQLFPITDYRLPITKKQRFFCHDSNRIAIGVGLKNYRQQMEYAVFGNLESD